MSVLTRINVLIGGALSLPGTSEVETTVDNELRFFSVLLIVLLVH